MKSVIYLLFISILIGCTTEHSESYEIDLGKGFIETKIIRGGKIWSLDWSPDDKYIACGNASGLLRTYNGTNLELQSVLTGFNATINSIHWSPDMKLIAASGGHQDPRVIIWNLESKTTIVIPEHSRQVRTVRWSPKGRYLASTSHDGTIRIWTREGQLVKVYTGANFGCVGIDWLDENKIVASCWDNTIRTYSLSGTDSLIIENGNHRNKAVLSVDWHPSGTYFASGDYGNEGDPIHAVKLWDNKGNLIREMTSHEKEIRSLAWNNTGDLLATGGETIMLRDKDGDLLKVFEPIVSPIWALDWNSTGDKLISGHNDGKIRIWNADGDLLSLIDGHSSETSSISFNKDSSRLFMGFSGGTLRFFNLENLTTSTLIAHSRSIRNITWSPNEQYIALSSNDQSFSVWSVVDDITASIPIFDKEKHSVKAISWNPDGLSVAYLDYNSSITVYSLDGEELYRIKANSSDDNAIEWKNNKPYSIQTEGGSEYVQDMVQVNIRNEKLSLIPLANNNFALVDTSTNRIVKGNKEDFVIIFEEENGFTNLKFL